MLPIEVFLAVMYFTFGVSGWSPEASPAPLSCLLWTLLSLGLFGAASEAATFLLRRWREAGAWQVDDGRAVREQAGFYLRILLFACFIIQMEWFGWPGMAGAALGTGNWRSLEALIGLLPFLAMLILLWHAFYAIEDAATRGRWSRMGYVGFRTRYNFYVLIPWLALMAAMDLCGNYLPGDWQSWFSGGGWGEAVLSIASLIAAGAIFPPILLRLWRCRPLPDGQLKERLCGLQAKAGVRFSGFYVWRIGGGILNAAALGLLPRFRYLLISESLLDRLTEDEICGVVGHELGHLRHRHLLFYLIFIFGFAAAASYMHYAEVFGGRLESALGICLLFAIYLRFGFGYVSRRFERQADLFGLELLGRAEPLVASLEKIAIITGSPRQKPCWHHASIAVRVSFLRAAEDDPRLGSQHHAEVARLKLGMTAIACGIFWFAAFGEGADRMRQDTPAAYSRTDWINHWRGLEALLPGDPEPANRLRKLLAEVKE